MTESRRLKRAVSNPIDGLSIDRVDKLSEMTFLCAPVHDLKEDITRLLRVSGVLRGVEQLDLVEQPAADRVQRFCHVMAQIFSPPPTLPR